MDLFSFILGKNDNEQAIYDKYWNIIRGVVREKKKEDEPIQTRRIRLMKEDLEMLARAEELKIPTAERKIASAEYNKNFIIRKLKEIDQELKLLEEKELLGLHEVDLIDAYKKNIKILNREIVKYDNIIKENTDAITTYKENAEKFRKEKEEKIAKIKKEKEESEKIGYMLKEEERYRQIQQNLHFYYNSSIIIADLSADNPENRYIFLWLNKNNFTNESPKDITTTTHYLKYFMNFWYAPTKAGGKNGFYYLKKDNPAIGMTTVGGNGKIYPLIPDKPMKDEYFGIMNPHLIDADLIIINEEKGNPFIHIYNDYYFTCSDAIAISGNSKFKNYNFLYSVGSKKRKMNIEAIYKQYIPANNIYVIDIQGGV